MTTHSHRKWRNVNLEVSQHCHSVLLRCSGFPRWQMCAFWQVLNRVERVWWRAWRGHPPSLSPLTPPADLHHVCQWRMRLAPIWASVAASCGSWKSPRWHSTQDLLCCCFCNKRMVKQLLVILIIQVNLRKP